MNQFEDGYIRNVKRIKSEIMCELLDIDAWNEYDNKNRKYMINRHIDKISDLLKEL